ncbi:MAG: hypothetical protein BHW64_00540 [Candidatus Melainabacteria bacterium LEY3_CP_29_8]|nr:MAG: hypothetical protein BHW64_00540 [Candidatus Melainabacteria bacterium LEY3_CP_29_8]
MINSNLEFVPVSKWNEYFTYPSVRAIRQYIFYNTNGKRAKTLSNKKLLEKFFDATFINSLYSSIINTSMDFFYKLQGFSECI